MKEGDRVLNRWRLTRAVAGSAGGVARWRGIDEATGGEVEVLLLPASRADADARRGFVDVHELLRRVGGDAGDPTVLAPTLQVDHEGTTAIAIRAPLADATLADVGGPLDPAVVAAIGAALVPAVMAAGPALRGALLASDIALDDQGRPVLAPLGAPLTRVARRSAGSAAPEAYAGAPLDGPAGLYGLGVLLYRLATGRDPARGSGGPPSPSTVRPGIPQALDDAVLRLLSADPARRVGALTAFRALAGPPTDLRPWVRSHPSATAVRVTTRADAPRSDRLLDPAALILVPAEALTHLEPAARSRAAGLAKVSQATVRSLEAGHLPLVVETRPSPTSARIQVRRLSAETGLPLVVSSGGGIGPVLPVLVAGATALAILPVAMVMAFLGLGFLVAPLMIAALGIVAAGAGVAVVAHRGRSLHRRALRALGQQAQETPADHLAPTRERLADVRLLVADADLPQAASMDLRQVLADLDSRLDRLARRDLVHVDTLKRVDASALRSRLGVLAAAALPDEAARAERDRLARTLADLEAVAEQRQGVAAEALEIRDMLDEIVALLGQLGEDPSEALLGDLARTTVRARATDARRAARQTESGS